MPRQTLAIAAAAIGLIASQAATPAQPVVSPEIERLLGLGAVQTAQSLAHQAVTQRPNDPPAQYSLAHALSHDLIGRRFGVGFDRDGAARALRTAIRLDPEDVEAYSSALADVLHRDANGVPYGPGADLDGAVAALRAILEDPDRPASGEYRVRLCRALSAAGRFEEVERLAESAPEDHALAACALQAVVVRQGPEAAIRRASEIIPPSGAGRALTATANNLARFRRYEAVNKLLDAAQAAASSILFSPPRESAPILPYTRYEDADSEPPVQVARAWLAAMLKSDDWKQAGTPLLSTCGKAEWRDPTRERTFRNWLEIQRRPLNAVGPYVERSLDTLIGRPYAIEGDDDRGYLVSFGEGSRSPLRFFVVREGERYRILDFAYGVLPSAPDVPCEVFRRVDAEDLAGAKVLLDWVREIGPRRPIWNFTAVWREGIEPDPRRIRLAAAMLQIRDASRAAEAAKVIEREMEILEAPSARSGALRDLSTAYEHACDWEKAYEVNARRLDGGATLDARSRQWFLLGKMGRRAELLAAIDEALQSQRVDARELTALGMAAQELSERKALERLARAYDLHHKPRSANYYRIAWAAIATDTVDQAALDAADRAVRLAAQYSSLERTTRAAAYALAGKPLQAREYLMETLSAEARPLKAAHWFVQGLIMEKLGMLDEARSAYERAKLSALGRLGSTAPEVLAARRLDRLEAEPADSP